MLKKFNLDSRDDANQVIDITNQAIEYVISRKAIESLEYILSFWQEKYIIPQISDLIVADLLQDNQNSISLRMLNALLSNEVIIMYNDNSEKLYKTNINDRNQSNKKLLSGDIKNSNIDSYAKSSEEEKDELFNDVVNRSLIFISDKHSSFEYEYILPNRFTSGGEYFRREHAVEIMFRSKMFTEEQEVEIIRKLYGKLRHILDSDSKIIKLLIVYNRFNIFRKIIEIKINTSLNESEEDLKLSFIGNEDPSNSKSIFSIDDIIIEAVKHWFKIDNILFFNKIFKVYRMRIEIFKNSENYYSIIYWRFSRR